MLYKLYLYKTTARVRGAICVYMVSRAIATGNEEWWHRAASYFLGFDTDSVKIEIERVLRNRCRVIERKPPHNAEEIKDKKYLYIATSYEMIKEVISVLYDIAFRNDLVLFDNERDKHYFREYGEDGFLQIRLRSKAFRQRLLSDMKPIRSIRMIWDGHDKGKAVRFYVVTINKDKANSFIERTRAFYQSLVSEISMDEELKCHDGFFDVETDVYRIGFCLEGYKKHSDRIGYYSAEKPCYKLTRRMSTEDSFRRLKEIDSENRAFERMNYLEMINKYENPADRFVASVKISLQEKKWDYDIVYGSDRSGSYIVFSVVPEYYFGDDSRQEHLSVLKLEEGWATFILPFVEDVYPYFSERYYLTDNHLPPQMWRRIIDRVNYSKNMILNDIHNAEFRKYIDQFNLYMLIDKLDSQKDYDEIKEDPAAFLDKNKGKVLDVYSLFLKWLEAQLQIYGLNPDGNLIAISGP